MVIILKNTNKENVILPYGLYFILGKYLLTLEKETVGSPVHATTSSISCTSSSNNAAVYTEDDTKMFVRIYANFWKFPESKLIDLPITIRIASMTTPKAPLVKSIDVIELPLRSPPDLIQCCQVRIYMKLLLESNLSNF